MSEAIRMQRDVPVTDSVDVLVVGAGIGGCTAAVAAAREGAATLVVDRFGRPGGNMGPGMICGAPDLELPPLYARGMPGVPGEFASAISRRKVQCVGLTRVCCDGSRGIAAGRAEGAGPA